MQSNKIATTTQPTSSSTDELLLHTVNCESNFGIRQTPGENEENIKSTISKLHKSLDEVGSKTNDVPTYSNQGDVCSVGQTSVPDHTRSKETTMVRYKRSFLHLLKNDLRSRCRPLCASKLQLLCIWRTHSSNYSGSGQQNLGSNVSASTSNEIPSALLSSQRMSSANRQPQTSQETHSSGSNPHHISQKNYFDHRSISSAHLMPSFAKRRFGPSAQTCAIGSTSSLPTSNDMLKIQNNSMKNSDHKLYSPQRKNMNKNVVVKLVQLTDTNAINSDKEHGRELETESVFENDREHNQNRCRDLDRDMNSTLPNVRERRFGSGRLLPRDNWDYHSEKDSSLSSGAIPFGKEISSHSASSGHNISRLGNQNTTSQKFDLTHRSPTSKDRSTGGKNSSEYRSESRYDSRKSISRSDYERENLSYLRRFMSDVIGQHSSNHFNSKTGSTIAESSAMIQQYNETRRRHHRNDEPEWFSSGPTSQHDTIELRGFDEFEEPNSSDKNSKSSSLIHSDVNYIKNGIDDKRNSEIHESIDTINNKSSEQASSPFLPNKTSPIGTITSKSDTNNNSPNNNYVKKASACNGGDEPATSISVLSETATADDKDVVSENKLKKENAVVQSGHSQSGENPSEFNFDAFLNVDPLNNSLVGEQNVGHSEVVSRFSQWFLNQDENLEACDIDTKSSFNKRLANNENSSEKQQEEPLATSLDSTDLSQTNTLMEFLQRGKGYAAINSTDQTAKAKPIPSVEELEARMRKAGAENTKKQFSTNMGNNVNPLNRFLNSVQYKSQEKYQPQVINSESQLLSADDLMNTGFQTQQQRCVSSQIGGPLSQTQDIEAFKKLLEQITPAALNIQSLSSQQQSHVRCAGQLSQQINILGTNVVPSDAPHAIKNEEMNKFVQPHQLYNRRQQPVAPGLQHLKVNQSASTENAMFLNPHQRYEAQLLLQGLSRGEITQNALEQQLSNPNTSPRTKEVLAAVLRESSRNTSPNVISTQPIMSPAFGQSPCTQSIPPATPSIVIPRPQQTPYNIAKSSGTQQAPHHTSATNSGGLPQRIPSPRELQYHTQSIMQNALIKKKLEEQQENFRRRQEVHKQSIKQQKPLQSPLKADLNDFSVLVVPSQQFSQSFQKKLTQPPPQQQGLQNQSQIQHLNSPTPLAFTPTSVLRKMTAEKDSVNSFHPPVSITFGENQLLASTPTSTMAAGNAGISNHNSNKAMQSLLMQYQQQDNTSQNVPRMILGVGTQQQQQSNALISGSHIQQVQPYSDSSRMNQQIRSNQNKWSGVVLNQIAVNKPIGRPILKGGPVQPTATNPSLNPTLQQQPQSPQAAFTSKIDFPKRTNGNQQQHTQCQKPSLTQTMIPQQQTQNITMTQLYHQRAAYQRAQQYQMHQHYQQQAVGITQTNNSRIDEHVGCGTSNNQSMSNCANIINYQCDGGLSPTSNQLARWFSPELLAQASAGKLPPLNMTQALSLEEFEKSIQHSSTVLNN